jgi:hypothetical protein
MFSCRRAVSIVTAYANCQDDDPFLRNNSVNTKCIVIYTSKTYGNIKYYFDPFSWPFRKCFLYLKTVWHLQYYSTTFFVKSNYPWLSPFEAHNNVHKKLPKKCYKIMVDTPINLISYVNTCIILIVCTDILK